MASERRTIAIRRKWMRRRLREIADWRCRCGRLLITRAPKCEWHEDVFCKALLGSITKEQAR